MLVFTGSAVEEPRWCSRDCQELKQYYERSEEDTLNLCGRIKMTTNCLELDPGTLQFVATFLTSQCTAVQE